LRFCGFAKKTKKNYKMFFTEMRNVFCLSKMLVNPIFFYCEGEIFSNVKKNSNKRKNKGQHNTAHDLNFTAKKISSFRMRR